MNSDEVDSRYVLLQNPKVGFADAIYYYWSNSQSITQAVSTKHFHYLCTELELHSLIKKTFGEESREMGLLTQQHEEKIKHVNKFMVLHSDILTGKDKIWVQQKYD